MALDLTFIKEHPYATGGVVIVGGLVVFYLLSSSQSSGAAPQQSAGGMSAADYQAYLAAQSQVAQTNAAAQVQANAQQVSLQQSQLEADVANNQTAAALATNNTNTAAQLAATLAQIQASTQQNLDTLSYQSAENAAALTAQTQQNRDALEAQTAQNAANLAASTTQQANQLTFTQNVQQMQDDVLMSQINSGVLENANNNATALAATESGNELQALIAKLSAATSTAIAGDQTAVALKGVDAATQVQLQQLMDEYNLTSQSQGQQYDLSKQTLNMVQAAGLNHGTTSLENSLVGTVGLALGYQQPATAAVTSNNAAAIASSQSTASIINGITGAVASLFKAA